MERNEMKRFSWSDGWHTINSSLDIYIEDGVFVRGTYGHGIDATPCYPYLPSREGGLDRAYGVKANKRNFERLTWR